MALPGRASFAGAGCRAVASRRRPMETATTSSSAGSARQRPTRVHLPVAVLGRLRVDPTGMFMLKRTATARALLQCAVERRAASDDDVGRSTSGEASKGARAPWRAHGAIRAPPVYLHGARLLYEALKGSGELTPALNVPELPSLGRDIYALVVEQMDVRVPNWRDLLPREVVEQI